MSLFSSDEDESCSWSDEEEAFQRKNEDEKNWTCEQRHVFEFVPQPSKVVMVAALPGTGKTTVCEKLIGTHASSNRKFFFTMLSLKLAQEANERISNDHVDCGTFHSLALQTVQKIYNNAMEVVDTLEHVDKMTLLFLEEFWLHYENDIELFYEKKMNTNDHRKKRKLDHENVLEKARKIWQKMLHGQSPVTHQAYLKICAVHPEALDIVQKKYQCIVVDEAQDVPPCFVHFLLQLKKCCIYFVGDPNQQIFSFAGAASAFSIDKIKHCVTTFSLTHSFRFGPHVADMANKTVLKCRKESHIPFPNIISTLETTHSVITFDHPPEQFLDMKEPFALICRYNATILYHLLLCLENQKSFHLIGAPMHDIVTMLPEWIQIFDQWKDKYQEFEHTKSKLYARPQGGSKEMQALKFIYQYPERVKSMFQNLDLFETLHQTENALITLVSAHQSKGMEFENVILANDYPDIFENVLDGPRLFDQDVKEIHQNNEETNILFVAMTRCKKKLYLNQMLGKYGKELFSEKLSSHFLLDHF